MTEKEKKLMELLMSLTVEEFEKAIKIIQKYVPKNKDSGS